MGNGFWIHLWLNPLSPPSGNRARATEAELGKLQAALELRQHSRVSSQNAAQLNSSDKPSQNSPSSCTTSCRLPVSCSLRDIIIDRIPNLITSLSYHHGAL
jgi:hypothetical protein